MLIPNANQAIVDIRKLRNYCLNSQHDDGKHKARLFSSMLGINANDAERLRQILLEIVKKHCCQLGRNDQYGQRYIIDFELEWQNKRAMVRSGWIIEHNDYIPKLTTCYPL